MGFHLGTAAVGEQAITAGHCLSFLKDRLGLQGRRAVKVPLASRN